MKSIPIYQPFLNGNEKKYVNNCLDANWISSRGDYIPTFEKAFIEYVGAKYATSVSNGTVALHLALMALNLGPGDEVIVPTLTYIASVNTIRQTGATPIFVDSLASTWQINTQDIVSKITAKTKAIMAVHLYGHPCDMDQLAAICNKFDLLLIEDCAQAFGTRYKGKHVGTFGDVATFSFFGNKTITTGEGGMVVSKSVQLHNRCCLLKSQAMSPTKAYWHEELGFNYRMTNICAAIGLAQLEQAETILKRKAELATFYHQKLNHLDVEFQIEAQDITHSHWMCSMLVRTEKERDGLRHHLSTHGIETRPLFYPAHMMPHFKEHTSYPVAENLSQRGLNLPSWPGLTDVELATIATTVSQYFSQGAKLGAQ